MAEVSVKRALVAEVGHHFAEIAEISAKLFGIDRRVFPTFPVEWLTWHVRRCTKAGLADFPDALRLRAGIELHVRRSRVVIQSFDQFEGFGLGFGECLAAELDHEPSGAFG